MVVMNLKDKWIYVKTAKTGSTTIQMYFLQHFMKEYMDTVKEKNRAWYWYSRAGTLTHDDWIICNAANVGYQPLYSHMKLEEIVSYLEQRGYDYRDFFIFTGTRNTYSQLVSSYKNFMRLINRSFKKLVVSPMIQSFINTWNKPLEWFKVLKYAKSRFVLYNCHYDKNTSFYDYLTKEHILRNFDCYTVNGEVKVDYFISQENLLADFKDLCQILDIPFRSKFLGRRNASKKKKDYRTYYTPKILAFVNERWADEISYHNYVFGGKEV